MIGNNDGVILLAVLAVSAVVYGIRRCRLAGRVLDAILGAGPVGRHAQGAAMDAGYDLSPGAYTAIGSMCLHHEDPAWTGALVAELVEPPGPRLAAWLGPVLDQIERLEPPAAPGTFPGARPYLPGGFTLTEKAE